MTGAFIRVGFVTVLCGLAVSAVAQEVKPSVPSLARLGEQPAEVMILGVFHFHNPGADFAKFAGIDVLTPERQREIADVTNGLAAFAPTKIAVEDPPEWADSINARYQRYRDGTLELSRNEIHQLGFRLARHLDLDQLYPVDFKMGMRIDSVMAYAASHDPAFVARFEVYIGEIVALFDRMQREETIAANLRFFNDPDNMDPANAPNVVQATVGAGDGYIGARVVAEWYERNLHIFANLSTIAEPGDRILFIVGAGHAPILRDLVRAHPSMVLVEPLEYLP